MYNKVCWRCQRFFFDLWHLQHAPTYISFGWIRIENQLNIKKVMSINVMSPYSVFWVSFHTFNIHSITALTVYFELLLTPLTYTAFWSIFQEQYSILHLWHLWHQSVCLIHLIYIVDSNSKYSNYMKFRLKALNYSKLRSRHQLNPLQIGGTSN